MKAIMEAIKALNLDVLSINPVKDSYSSTVRILELKQGQRVVLKIPFSKEKLLREEKALGLLAANPLVPRLLNMWYGDDSNTGALLLSYIDGVPMVLPANEETIYEMGKALAEIHTVKLDRFELDDWETDWAMSVKNKIASWVLEIQDFISPLLLESIDIFLNEKIKLLNQADGPCLVHFDYRPGNVLVRHGKIVGVIDFETSRGGSAEIDFTKVSNLIWKESPEHKRMFLEGYTSVRKLPNLQEVLPIYSFYHAIGGMAWCVRRGQLEDAFFYENLSALQAILKADESGSILR